MKDDFFIEEVIDMRANEKPITKIDIITRVESFDKLKEALNRIGITGMTVSNVLGCGMQKGYKEYYRGSEVEINLRPKVRVEVVVCEVPVQKVVDTAMEILRTGNIGDGKIFVSELANAYKIRTGESGWAALQDIE
ncbi:MAG: P-II family nitrogen regulator [Bacillota bacterium]